MPTESFAAALPGTAVPLPVSARRRISLYLSVLIVLLAFGAPSGGLIDVPVSFLLKNKLHLSAHALAVFRLLAGLPLYLSVVFGYLRDVWNPLGLRDRGFLILFGAAAAALYGVFAFVPANRATLLAALLLLTVAYQFVAGAQSGLTSVIGQQHVMSGQMSTVWNVSGALPGIAALLLGGALSDRLEGQGADAAARLLFLAGAAVMAAVALYGVWKPASVFAHVRPERPAGARRRDDLRLLLRHGPVWTALLIWLLWNFAPGSATPLQYYLQDTLHADDAAWGIWNAIFSAAFLPTFLLYGVLCRRVALRGLLWWGTLAAVPQMVPLLFVHSLAGALVAAVPIGLMGGVATAAYFDLIIRACPRGLQGSVVMMSNGLAAIATRFGDVLGTELYDRFGGFTVCVVAITLVYALILPALRLLPPALTATADGEVAGG